MKLHTLRHTVGSIGTGAGLSILMVSNVLGHQQTVTSERYAHVDQDPLRAADTRISEEIQALLDAETTDPLLARFFR